MHPGSSHRHNIAACIALLLGACSHAVQSPQPALSKTKTVDPDLVCNAQLETSVVIHGSGFTPAPVDTLSEPTQLWLPSITLTRHADLQGNDTDTAQVKISGKPSERDKHSDHNTWQSAKQMTLYVDDTLKLDPGLYDLQVENPDGASRVDDKRALAVVPPPELVEIRPPAICVDQSDIELTLIGKNFLRYGDALPKIAIETKDGDMLKTYDVSALNGCNDVPDRAQDAKLCTDAVFSVPQKDLDPGTYRVVLTNPAPAGCSSTEPLEVKVNPPPKVDSVVPASVCSGGSILVATGQDFTTGATAELRCTGGATLTASSVDVNADGSTATMMFGAGAVPGENCDVVVRNPDGCEDRPLPHKTVVGTEGPILFYTAPPVVYNGITTQVKLYVTALMPPFTVNIRPSDGGDPIELTAIQDPANGRRLQASVPASTAPGAYDVMVADATSCTALLAHGLTVTDKQSIQLSVIQPTFGQSTSAQAVTVLRKGGDAFSPTPMVFLSPKGSDAPAVQLEGVSVVNNDTLTAVVPPNTPKGTYNLVVVDPKSGAVGVLENAYISTQDAPPVVDEVTPQSIINATGQALTIRGTSFAGASVSLTCEAPGQSSTMTPSVMTGAQSCSNNHCQVAATVDGGALAEGSVCVVRVSNADGSYYDFSAIGVTNSSQNLAQSRAGTKLQTARRALSSAAVKATAASRFVYAIGGDTGPANAGSPLASVEFAPVDIYGKMSAWQTNPHALPAGRSSAASAVIGRYIYVYGGSDGSAALSSGARAMVLSPRETPVLDDLDLCLSAADVECFGQKGRAGLQSGTYSYRVAAVIDEADALNLGGETLASDPLSLSLPDINGRGIVVKLFWSKPVDSQNAALSGVTGYRIYRTAKNGAAGADEVLLASVGASATEFVDDGSRTLGTDKPLAPGSTSAWKALPALNTARNRLRGLAAADPDTDGAFFLYALLGKNNGADSDNTGSALASYEYLTVTTQANGRQSVGSWTQPGGMGFSAGRWNHGAWLADATVSNHIPEGTQYIYVGGGRNGPMNGGIVGGTEVAAVGGDGTLSGFASAQAMSTDRVGFGMAAAANRLFVFGGWPSGSIRDNAESLSINATPPTLATSVNSEGGLSVGEARFMPGSALQSAFIFIVGGQTTSGGNVTDSTALIVQ